MKWTGRQWRQAEVIWASAQLVSGGNENVQRWAGPAFLGHCGLNEDHLAAFPEWLRLPQEARALLIAYRAGLPPQLLAELTCKPAAQIAKTLLWIGPLSQMKHLLPLVERLTALCPMFGERPRENTERIFDAICG